MFTIPMRFPVLLMVGLFLCIDADAREPEGARDNARQASLRPAAVVAPDIPLHEYDWESEQRLLELANRSRAQVGAPPLTLDPGLTEAARQHAAVMFEARQISHQFEGEPPLAQRIAATTSRQLDQDGENVAYDFDAENAHHHLMKSPPHRANLLNPAYNVVGLGVVRTGDRLYVVQDFGHAVESYSLSDVKEHISAVVEKMRRSAGKAGLQRRDHTAADQTACSMAEADRLDPAAIHQLAQRQTVLTFTTLSPESLPAGATRAITGPNLRTYSVGTCYRHTRTYPMGVYWVVLSLQ